MKIHQSIKQTNLEERKQAFLGEIRYLRIKILDTNPLAYTEDSGKATQDRNVSDSHSCVRPVFTDRYMTGKSSNRVFATVQRRTDGYRH
jgi:hypothetical protein